ncbi:MAG: hypothetical protein LVQ95_00910 [Candidatus Micrarchaeales archaeon]|nr:hypothetical protein [Candidatus Micrarchaeales archaeon]
MAAASKTGNQSQNLGIEPLLVYDSIRVYKVLGQLVELVKAFTGADGCRNPTEIRKSAFEKFCSELSYSGVEPRDLVNEIGGLKEFLSKNGLALDDVLSDFDKDSQLFPCTAREMAALVDGIGYMDCTLNDIGERKARLRGSSDVNLDHLYPGTGTVWESAGKGLKLTSQRKREFVLALGDVVMSNSIRLYYSRNAPLEDEKEFESTNGKAIFSFMDKLAAIAKRYGINPKDIALLDLSGKMEESAVNRSALEKSKSDATTALAQYFSDYVGIKSETAAGMAKAFTESKSLWLPDIERTRQQGQKFGSLSLDALWKNGDEQLQTAAHDGTALAEAIAGIAIPNGIRGYASSHRIAVYLQASKEEVDKAGEVVEYVMEYYLDKKSIAEFENKLRSKQIDPSKITLPDLRSFSGDIVAAQSKEERNNACKKATDALAEYLVSYLGIDQPAAMKIASKYSSFDDEAWKALRRGLLEKNVPERKAKEEAPGAEKLLIKMQDINRYNFWSADIGTIWKKAGVQPSKEDREKLATYVARELVAFGTTAVMERLYFEIGEGRSGIEPYGVGKRGKGIESFAIRLGINPGEIKLLDLRPEIKAFIESKSDEELQQTAYEPAERKIMQYLTSYFGVNDETAKIIMQDCVRGNANENYYGWPSRSLRGIAVPDSAIAAGEQPHGKLWESTRVKSISQDEKDGFAMVVPQAAILDGIRAYLADASLPQELVAAAAEESDRFLKPVLSGIAKLGVDRSVLKLPDLLPQMKQVADSEYEEDSLKALQGVKCAIANYLVDEFGVGLVRARTEAENYVGDNRLWAMLPRQQAKPKPIKEETPPQAPQPPARVPAPTPQAPAAPAAIPPAGAPAPALQTPLPVPQTAATPKQETLQVQLPKMEIRPSGEIASKLWAGANIHTEVVNLVAEMLAQASLFASMAKSMEGAGAPEKTVAEARESAKKAWDRLAIEVKKELLAMKREVREIVLLDVSPQITSMLSGGKVGYAAELETILKNYLASYGGTDRASSIATNYVDDLILTRIKQMVAKSGAAPAKGAELRTEERDGAKAYWPLDTSEADQGILDLLPSASASVADYVALAATSAEVSVIDAILAVCENLKTKSQKIPGIENRTRRYATEMKSWQKSAEAAKQMKFEKNTAVKMLFLEDVVSEFISSDSSEQRAVATAKLDMRLMAYLTNYMKMPLGTAKTQTSQKISLVNTLLFDIPGVEIRGAQAPVSSPPVPTRTVGGVGVARRSDSPAVTSEKEARAQRERVLLERLKLGDMIKVFTTERTGAPMEGDMLRYEVRTKMGGFPSIHTGTSFFLEGGVLDTYMSMRSAGKNLERKHIAAIDVFGPRIDEARKAAAELAELDKIDKDFGALRTPN